MSRTRLSLYRMDRVALRSFEAELRAYLAENDRSSLITLLSLHGDLSARIEGTPRAVDCFLVPDSFPPSAPLFAALRRAAKQRALSLEWTSDSPALEGRLQGFDGIREDPGLSRAADALLDRARVPWFLRQSGGTCGVVTHRERIALSEGLEALDDPPHELVELGHALGAIDGEVLSHDTLS